MKDEFLKRLPATAAEERAMVEAAFGLRGTVAAKANEIRSNTRLSDAGKADDIRAMARGTPLQHLRQIRQRAANMAADVANQRRAFAPPTPDRSDLFGEAQRSELRAFVRGMSQEQRLRAVMNDESLAEAVLQAHPSLSGLTTQGEDGAPSQYDLVRDQYLQSKFGEQIRAVERREEVVEVLNSAVEIASSQFKRETGLDDQDIA
jgi:hypothetical protein